MPTKVAVRAGVDFLACKKEANIDGKIFVWRRVHNDMGFRAGGFEDFDTCIYCAAPLNFHKDTSRAEWDTGQGEDVRDHDCPLCGWSYHQVALLHTSGYPMWREDRGVLRCFDINSTDLGLSELGAHLRQRFSDVCSLSWRRFEELAADVFRSHGWQVVLTQATRDGGADLILLHKRSGEAYAIVECKKYSKSRRVGVEVVRTLVGAAVDWNVHRAYLVTSSDFTREALTKAAEYGAKDYQVSLDLVSATEFLTLLNVYNVKMPPLEKLSEKTRAEIILANGD
jgi:hypothetical protein